MSSVGIKITVSQLFSLIFTLSLWSQIPPENRNYRLVFEEEFDSSAMDRDTWKSYPDWNQTGNRQVPYCENIPGGIISNDLYGYRKMDFENCLLDTTGSGTLTIVSKEERYYGEVWNFPPCTDDSCRSGTGYSPCTYDHDPPICVDIDSMWFNYTTNEIVTREKFKYGYFEIRCRIPVPEDPLTNTGVGPNFWLWGVKGDVSWSEIDIFEFNGATNAFGSSIHYENSQGDTLHGIPDHPPLIEVNDSQFHTYAVHWKPNVIHFYFDNEIYLSTWMIESKLVEMPMIIDVNLPLHTLCQLVDKVSTKLPHHYEIDYVRVYEKFLYRDYGGFEANDSTR
jgi:hypothetical protein